MQEQEKKLFEDYEIKSWNFSPRLYKIIGAAAAFNLLAILVIGQANLLTRKGCDSPFVNRICQVLDTVYVGSMLFGTDAEFVSKDYEQTELADADITFIDVTGETPPLTYPEGYFALANPEEFAMMQNSDFITENPISGIPGIPTNPTIENGADLLNSPQVLPTPNDNAIKGTIPDSPFSFGANPTIKYPRAKRVRIPKPPKVKNTLPDFESDATAENNTNANTDINKDKTDKPQKPIESDAVSEVEINKKPFEDLGDAINDKLAKKEIDLSKSFSVVLDGAITADGKLDPKKSRFVKFDGDEQMVNVAKDAIEAVGNSGFLGYLKNNGIDRVNFTMVQDDKQIYVIIISDQKTAEKAGTVASGFNTLLSGIKVLDQNGLKKLDENSKTLVNNSKVTSDGKNFVLKFTLPKQDAQNLINRSLKERAEKKNNQPDNSSEVGQNSNTKKG
ncbi:MAG: hypothetical protein H0V31_11695 [Acidobacteria bacterium]|nr:hypothetical protein [Acidobacteriota bacterium]